MSRVLVVAPHPDDETLGCGGTLLRHKADGDEIHWLILTSMHSSDYFDDNQVKQRDKEIAQVFNQYNFDSIEQFNFEPAGLNDSNKGELISKICDYLHDLQPDIVYAPYFNDAHSDHFYASQGVISACKSFRAPFVTELMVYETISETDFGLAHNDCFKPNTYVDIGKYLQKKLDIMSYYDSEIGEFPFPRSLKAIEALALLRGSQCNAQAAEAFMLLKRYR